MSGIEGRQGMYAWYGSNARDVCMVSREGKECMPGMEVMLGMYVWYRGKARKVCLVWK